MDIFIRPYERGDESKILQLFFDTFGFQVSMDWWRWRFIENPIDRPRIHLAFDGDKLVSHYAVSPFQINIGDETRLAALSMTTMTDQRYRSFGLFPKTAESLYTELQKDDYVGVFGFPNHLSHVPFLKKLGWRNIFVQHSLKLNVENIRRKDVEQEFNVERFSIDSPILNTLPFGFEGRAFYSDLRGVAHWRFSKKAGEGYAGISVVDAEGTTCAACIYKSYAKTELDLVWVYSSGRGPLQVLLDYLVVNSYSEPTSCFNVWACVNSDMHLFFEELGAKLDAPSTYFCGRIFDEAYSNLYSAPSWRLSMSTSDVY